MPWVRQPQPRHAQQLLLTNLLMQQWEQLQRQWNWLAHSLQRVVLEWLLQRSGQTRQQLQANLLQLQPPQPQARRHRCLVQPPVP